MKIASIYPAVSTSAYILYIYTCQPGKKLCTSGQDGHQGSLGCPGGHSNVHCLSVPLAAISHRHKQHLDLCTSSDLHSHPAIRTPRHNQGTRKQVSSSDLSSARHDL